MNWGIKGALRGYAHVVKLFEVARRSSCAGNNDVESEDIASLELERDGWTYRCLLAWSGSSVARDRVEAERACPAVKAFAELLRGEKKPQSESVQTKKGGINPAAVRRRRAESGGSVVRDPDAVGEFIADCEALVADASELPEASDDFADSVIEKAEGMALWADSEGCFTESMASALENMAAGVARWQR